jgi:hypothetical protein
MRGAGSPSSSFSSSPSPTTVCCCNFPNIAAGAGSSTPESRVLPIDVHCAENGKRSHETFAAPKRSLPWMREVPWTSNLLTERQRERNEKLFSLVDPDHIPMREQFS